MQITLLVLALIGAIIGLFGLVTMVKGFLDKSNSKIWLGTVLVGIMLAIGICGSFVLTRKVVNAKRNAEKECRNAWKNFKSEYVFGLYKPNCNHDSTKCDSMKMNMPQEAGMPCPHHKK